MLTAKCTSNENATYLEVTIHADPSGQRVDEIGGDILANGKPQANWGLHLIDVNLAMGNLVDIIGQQRSGLAQTAEMSAAPSLMLSYARGPAATVVRKTIGQAFLETANRFPDSLALVSRHQNIRLTWSDYARQAQRVAAGLRALGIIPGDRVGIWSTTCAEWPIIQFGCALAGVILVNVNPASRTHELSLVLRKSRMVALFLHEQDQRANYKSILEESRAGQTLALKHVVYLGSSAWDNFLREPDGVTVSPDPGEAANIQYTSGTTGEPKGVMLTHVNLVNNGRFFTQYLRLKGMTASASPCPCSIVLALSSGL